jgi:predicted RNA-binding protein associated with RNAse of E/G family
LTFETGDILREIFSPVHPFNAFAAYTAQGDFKGWYANVTYPTLLDTSAKPSRLIWHDLFIDIVATSDGTVAVLDEDELTDSGLADTDPDLAAQILAALDHLLARFQRRQPPFYQSEINRPR